MKFLLPFLALFLLTVTARANGPPEEGTGAQLTDEELAWYTTQKYGCYGSCDYNAVLNAVKYAERHLWPFHLEILSYLPEEGWVDLGVSNYNRPPLRGNTGGEVNCFNSLQPVVNCYVTETDEMEWDQAWDALNDYIKRPQDAFVGGTPWMLSDDDSKMIGLVEETLVARTYLLRCSGLQSCFWEDLPPGYCCDLIHESPGKGLICQPLPLWPFLGGS
jgi:hypothetical protein